MDKDFWNQRAKRFGTTGYADPLLLAFDQPLRVRTVFSLLNETHASHRGTMLDFGCGTGDFSAAAASCFDSVDAFDISDEVVNIARRRLRERSNVAFVSRPLARERYDTVLCITVLQHIVDEEDFRQILAELASSLKPGGLLLVLESVGLAGGTEGGYVKSRTEIDWMAAFVQAGLTVVRKDYFYNPLSRPTDEYLQYRRSTRLLRMCAPVFKRVPPLRRLMLKSAQSTAGRILRLAPAASGIVPEPTRLAFFACRKDCA